MIDQSHFPGFSEPKKRKRIRLRLILRVLDGNRQPNHREKKEDYRSPDKNELATTVTHRLSYSPH